MNTTLCQSGVLPTRQYYVSSSANVTDSGQGLAERKLNSHLHCDFLYTWGEPEQSPH